MLRGLRGLLHGLCGLCGLLHGLRMILSWLLSRMRGLLRELHDPHKPINSV